MSKIKLALVDDELTSRNTLKKFLENHDTYEIVSDFSNGKAALEWLRKNDIDILLCDMQMAEMNGVELMRCVHIINEYLPVIAVSGFDDFDFVRGSLINGAANYLLKHELTKEKLIQVLDQVREKYRIIPQGNAVYHRAGYCIRDEEEFTAEHIRKMAEEGKIDFGCYHVAAIAVGPDYKFGDGIRPSEYKQDICKAVIDIMAQILGENYKYLIYFTRQGHLIILLSFQKDCSTLLMINTIHNLSGRLQRQIVRMLDITVTIVNGDVQREVGAAIADAKRLDSILEDKLYLGGNRIIQANLSKKLVYDHNKVSENLWKQLKFELENNLGGCMDTLHEIFDTMESERYSRDHVSKSCRHMVELLKQYREFEEKEVLERVKEYEIFEQFRVEILELYNKILFSYQPKQNTYSPLVSQAVDYVKKNYANDISLEKCAEFTGSSYSYLSREFKKETGMRFVEFLNRQRLNKAKSLLIRQGVPMKEIVERSGFRNYNYFFKVFKEVEGITPSKFLAKK